MRRAKRSEAPSLNSLVFTLTSPVLHDVQCQGKVKRIRAVAAHCHEVHLMQTLIRSGWASLKVSLPYMSQIPAMKCFFVFNQTQPSWSFTDGNNFIQFRQNRGFLQPKTKAKIEQTTGWKTCCGCSSSSTWQYYLSQNSYSYTPFWTLESSAYA